MIKSDKNQWVLYTCVRLISFSLRFSSFPDSENTCVTNQESSKQELFQFSQPHFLPSTCPLRSDLFISSLPQVRTSNRFISNFFLFPPSFMGVSSFHVIGFLLRTSPALLLPNNRVFMFMLLLILDVSRWIGKSRGNHIDRVYLWLAFVAFYIDLLCEFLFGLKEIETLFSLLQMGLRFLHLRLEGGCLN